MEILIKEIIETHHANGGSTTALDGSVPTGGYVVSPYPDVEEKHPYLTKNILESYIYAYKYRLAQTKHYLGTWLDETTSMTYLDVVIVVETLEQAIQIAKRYNQKAIYDLEKGETIYV